MKQATKTLLSLFSLTLTVACDARAPDDHVGDSLLHLEGSVTIAGDDAPSDLVPALAFATKDGYALVDVAVRGDFPNNFVLDVLEAPPAGAVADSRLSPGHPLALAHITAVRRDHPATIIEAHYAASTDKIDLAGCRDAHPGCLRQEQWCVDEAKTSCRTVGYPCAATESCAFTVSEGDDNIWPDSSEMFAGLSENFVAIWTSNGLPSDTTFSHLLGLKENLGSGYSLIHADVRPSAESASDASSSDGPDGSESAESEVSAESPAQACANQFRGQALALYNTAHGTHFADEDELEEALASDEHASDAAQDELHLDLTQVAIQNGCDVSVFDNTYVAHDASAKLHIRIAPNVEPWF